MFHTATLRFIDAAYWFRGWWEDRETAYCPETNTRTCMESTGGNTGDPYRCSECGYVFGIHPSHAANSYDIHVTKTRMPAIAYRVHASVTELLHD